MLGCAQVGAGPVFQRTASSTRPEPCKYSQPPADPPGTLHIAHACLHAARLYALNVWPWGTFHMLTLGSSKERGMKREIKEREEEGFIASV